MTQSTKERVITGVIVGSMMIMIQFGFTAFSGRWSKGAKTNGFLEKETYNKDRIVDKEDVLKKAFGYSDKCIEKFNGSYLKDQENIKQKIQTVEKIQNVQVEGMKKDIEFIKNWVIKQ